MRIGQKYITGTFAADQWVKIYENILSSAATSVTISSLDGDTDEEYRLIVRGIGGVNSTTLLVRPNNDSGSNYGYQELYGQGSTAAAARGTFAALIGTPFALSANENSLTELLIYAKSGYVRPVLIESSNKISGTTVGAVCSDGNVWNNTADNITSLVVFSDQTNGLGIGSLIELYKKKYKS